MGKGGEKKDGRVMRKEKGWGQERGGRWEEDAQRKGVGAGKGEAGKEREGERETDR